ncbi:hypothetical protein [Streptomyces sp. NPDC019937]|uniref:hypothetical protein n=1 Tax=Streptomyces sp. NPDC019937 TaxID=3154787 RepID=UPI0033F50009
MGRRKKSRFGGLERWWGALTAALLIAAWINSAAGPAVVITLSLATLAWCAFQAPVTCGAPVLNHDGGCRENAYGLLMGCYRHHHRWQKLKMVIWRRQMKEFCSELFSDGQKTIVTLAGIGSLLSGLVAFIPGLAL